MIPFCAGAQNAAAGRERLISSASTGNYSIHPLSLAGGGFVFENE
jgi:hypothetical protein